MRGPAKLAIGDTRPEGRIVQARIKPAGRERRAICNRASPPCPCELGFIRPLVRVDDEVWQAIGISVSSPSGSDAVGLAVTGAGRYDGPIEDAKIHQLRTPADEWGPELVQECAYALIPRTAFRLLENGDYAFVRDRRDHHNRLIGRRPLPAGLRDALDENSGYVGAPIVDAEGRGLFGQIPFLPAIVACRCGTRNRVVPPGAEE